MSVPLCPSGPASAGPSLRAATHHSKAAGSSRPARPRARAVPGGTANACAPASWLGQHPWRRGRAVTRSAALRPAGCAPCRAALRCERTPGRCPAPQPRPPAGPRRCAEPTPAHAGGHGGGGPHGNAATLCRFALTCPPSFDISEAPCAGIVVVPTPSARRTHAPHTDASRARNRIAGPDHGALWASLRAMPHVAHRASSRAQRGQSTRGKTANPSSLGESAVSRARPSDKTHPNSACCRPRGACPGGATRPPRKRALFVFARHGPETPGAPGGWRCRGARSTAPAARSLCVWPHLCAQWRGVSHHLTA